MKINIKATNITLTDAIRDHLNEKLHLLEKILPPGDESVIIDAEVGKESRHHKAGEIFKAEVNLHFSGNYLYANAADEDLYAAIDAVRDDITRQINSSIEKKNTLIRRGGRAVKNMLRGLYGWRPRLPRWPKRWRRQK